MSEPAGSRSLGGAGGAATAPPAPAVSRLEARYLASLPPLYYPLGAMFLVVGLLPLLGAGTMIWDLPRQAAERPIGATFSLITIFLQLGLGALTLSYGAGLVAAGWALARRRRFGFCRLMGWLACLFFPFGTLAGVMTLLLLRRPGVRALFSA